MYKWNLVNLKIHIGRIILLYRLRKELSQFQLGLEVGMSRDHIGRIERGQTNPTIENIVKISDFLNIDILIFFIELNQNELSNILDEIKNLKEKNKNIE
ncbi:helix-turn-helix domain-containing protein [Epilithonimonas zeae]|uniref:DNA-binding transcriptional regulator, XRE-family HTH domain n=1 Tax=Epilithonimonas zeae TaxID=1416779 RepID=A0A1N6FSQ1_9FLAO|nr:helix-turn-helix transcriptional regulator [Epilithonimonas zeae]SIN98349.1 DNA-binding transcriptional regulator, XRE-family HTH domain [Epilithonimonas zeae]